ncbi:MAG: glycoside hydrolase family 32 protein [Armatimonadota bacterium]|jgi:beta-fructofuranosidase
MTEQTTEQLRAQRREAEQRFETDPYRPRYHFLPPKYWMNDPNGPIWHDGQYHLFYQHNPAEAKWGDIHWGHAVSGDLLHWEDWPIALAPRTEGVDQKGCFTGCAFVQEDGTPTIAYTGITPAEDQPRGRRENQSLAVSRDGMVTWEKLPQNPVIDSPPEGLSVVGFRDPCVWREGDAWYMLIGSGFEGDGDGGTALLYRSADLLDWQYLHPLLDADLTPPLAERGGMWECPDFFPLGERHVLLVSTLGRQRYISGGWSGERFLPGAEGWADFGPSFYAGKSFEDARGRRILWGWLREARELPAQLAAGWSGAMSLPRVLAMRADGSLGCEPAGELERLRAETISRSGTSLSAGDEETLPLGGDCVEVAAEVALAPGARFTLAVRCSPDGEERTDVYFDAREGRVGIDTSASSLDPAAQTRDSSGSLALSPDEPLRLRVFVDRSVVEVFANERACVTERVYPGRADSLGLRIGVRGGDAAVTSLRAWRMRGIWREV